MHYTKALNFPHQNQTNNNNKTRCMAVLTGTVLYKRSPTPQPPVVISGKHDTSTRKLRGGPIFTCE